MKLLRIVTAQPNLNLTQLQVGVEMSPPPHPPETFHQLLGNLGIQAQLNLLIKVGQQKILKLFGK